VPDVVLLSLGDGPGHVGDGPGHVGDSSRGDHSDRDHSGGDSPRGDGPRDGASGRDGCCASQATYRVPVLTCVDALRDGGARVDVVMACSDAEIDTAVKTVEAGGARLVVAAATDGQLRAVVRRLVRRYVPPPSKRSAPLPADRTVLDLPPLAVLPLVPAVPDLVPRLGLPQQPASVAAATLGGRERRLDLLRNDAGSVTLHGCMLGGFDAAGRPAPWRGRVEVDGAVLTNGEDPVIGCSICNAGASDVDGLPLVVDARPDDGVLDVAVALPVVRRRLLREASVRFEVRRARGRAVSVTPRDEELHLVDDGVAGVLTRKRAWWMERAAWAAYVM